MFNLVLQFIKGLVEREAARLIGYASAGAVAGALFLANVLHVELTQEAIAGISAIAVFVATELIRRFVFAIDTTQAIAERAAATGDPSIGSPPNGSVQ